MVFKANFSIDKSLWLRFKAKCKIDGSMASVKLRELIIKYLRGK